VAQLRRLQEPWRDNVPGRQLTQNPEFDEAPGGLHVCSVPSAFKGPASAALQMGNPDLWSKLVQAKAGNLRDAGLNYIHVGFLEEDPEKCEK